MDDNCQTTVNAFLEEHDLESPPENHVLDLSAEVGEIAGAINASTEYGSKPERAQVPRDELGDAMFSLLAVCASLDVDATAALEESIEKYERRIEESGNPGSS
ncbi:MazG nucleotide pyrophosphohydrolase domain-containing protein [Halostagnicola sp. A-GB9-2]|uniref:MazG nucleotide pyrophosphohydrolase domain-containing protein n=1 Tax=Halostagnicola sp. A-GB9-2 TaxID=3048066 RepID=UPI0024C0A4F4|nr:MazG nucleotide pyrophosphohydrolase domain-containing protein [Halostagnicola sp. A-GB9-2]MDJ1434035.1 MazG nucleotide pyrophosphohydrolase domain-containing protein [Halostagnicola sp. A-GB9-2]